MEKFKEIIGYETIKEELYRVLDMIKNPDKYEKLGAKLPAGIVLHGKPGIGKTMLSKAFIEESGLKAYVIRRNASKDNFIKSMTDTFKEAEKNAPSIILLDDMDKFANDDDAHRDSEEFVSLQACIDDIHGKGVFVIATTNDLDDLPHSLIRKGRFDNILFLSEPNKEEAKEIIKFYLRKRNVVKDINCEDIANMTSYSSCAELDSIINEAGINAGYANKESIDIYDILKAVLKSTYNVPYTYNTGDKEALRDVAIHEAGHAVVSEAILKGSVGLISIAGNDGGSHGGFTHICERAGRRPHEIAIGLGGKVAVEMYVGGRVASGCGEDLQRVCRYINEGITESGTLGLDLLSYQYRISNDLQYKQEQAVATELNRYTLIVKDILYKNKEFLEKLTDELVEKQTLLYSDIQRIRESVKVTEAIL